MSEHQTAQDKIVIELQVLNTLLERLIKTIGYHGDELVNAIDRNGG